MQHEDPYSIHYNFNLDNDLLCSNDLESDIFSHSCTTKYCTSHGVKRTEAYVLPTSDVEKATISKHSSVGEKTETTTYPCN